MRQMRVVVAMAVLLGVSSLLLAVPFVLTSPSGVAVDASGNVAVTCGPSHSVVLMTRTGKKVAEFGADILVNPIGIAIDGKGNFIVASAGKGEVVVFSPSGKVIASCAGLANPQTVAVAPSGLMYVADTGHNRIAVLEQKDAELKVAFAFDKVSTGEAATAALKAPMGVAVADGRLYIADSGNGRVLVCPAPTQDGAEVKANVITHFGMAPRAITVVKDAKGNDGKEVLVTLDENMLKSYSPDGKPLVPFACNNGQWFSPSGVTSTAQGEVMVTDQSSCRVYVTDANLTDAAPEVKSTRDSATITWTTLKPSASTVKWGTNENCDQTAGDSKPTTTHSVTLKDLKPSTRYCFHAFSPAETIPTTCEDKPNLALEIQSKSWHIFCQGYGREIPFVTDHKPGVTDWVYTPTIILVYKNIKLPPGPDGKAQPNHILDDKDVAGLKGQFEKYRLWVWRHTSCKVNFDWTYVIVDEERDNSQLGGFSEPVYKDMVKGVKAQGKDPKDFWYTVVCGTAGWYAEYLAGKLGDYEMGSCYTGYGHNQPDGWWWFPTHEHGHLMHSWIMCSGLHYFSNPDGPQTLPGKFGENFSYLAADWRQMPPRNLLCLKKTRLEESADSDGSGVPDEDARVPMDKKRFGWTKDMKGNCLQHLMAGVRTPGYTGDTTTDFEGKVHKLNPGELYYVDRKAKKGTPRMDGTFDEKDWTEFASVPALYTPKDAAGLHAKLYLAWDDNNYYFCIRSNKLVRTSIDLDGKNDGWWHSRDNLRFDLNPAIGDKKAYAGGTGIWDFLNDAINVNPGSGQWYQLAYKPGNTDLTCASGKDGEWYVLQGVVPARPDYGIQPKLGSKFGLRVDLFPTVEKAFPGVAFWDGEDFVFDIECVAK